MNGYYLYFTLLILSNIKIIVPFYDEFSKLNINSDFDEDNDNDYTFKFNMKNLFLYGTHLSEFLISQDKSEEEYINETIKLYNVFRNELDYILKNVNASMTPECSKYLEKYLIGKDEPYPLKYSNYHVKKLIDDSSKHRNDLSTYEQCMNKNYKLERKGDNESKGNMTSTYFVYTLDRRLEKKGENLTYPKNSTDFEQIYFIRGFCLPQSEKDICTEKDYETFLDGINNDLDDLLGINVTKIYTFYIRKNKDEFTQTEFYFSLVPFIICLIQVSLVICRELIIYSLNKCFGYNIKNGNNDLIEEFNGTNNKDENDEDDDENDKVNDNEKILNHKNVPKWIIIYNKCFNFSENFKELFNFKLNSTSINNDSGLTYIRGLKASSLFMLVAGLTFLTLMNSLSIIFSKILFLEFLEKRIFYSLFFVGLRYAPRFIFSCSGYTLAYKFLSYIDKDFSFLSIIKFIFYQSHKYLILIGYFLFQRFSLYPLFSSFNTPMLKFLNISILKRPDEFKNIIISFLTLSSFFMGNQSERYDQTLIDYFWLPYNEIAFFISGIFIISIGYKFKLRIDYFLLIMIFILYIFKIVFTYLYIPGKEGYKEPFYPTLYYYLFDYGKFMINPLFNYPSYFIGMYFGFINYCVQKGIISINVSDLFQNKTKTSTKNISEKEMNLSINANKSVEEEEEDDDDDEENNEENNEIIKKNLDVNDANNYRNEIIEMPFLIAGVKISNWLRNHGVRLITALMIFLFFCFISTHFFALNYSVTNEYYQKINDLQNPETPEYAKEGIRKRINELLLLTDYLTNGIINFIYRIDIEIVVFLFQSVLFIFYFKGKNFVNNFYCHIFWAMFNKSYFSYILVANPIILFIFYQSETKILLNLYNLVLYSLINGIVIFLSASFLYIFFELPYKKLIRFICSDDSYNNELEENEKEEETKSEDEDD